MASSCTPKADVLKATQSEISSEIQFASMAKALSHPARVRILKILLNLDKLGGCLNSDLVSELGLAQSTVSEHLRILKVAELITAEPIPPKMCYRVNKEKIAKFKQLFETILS